MHKETRKDIILADKMVSLNIKKRRIELGLTQREVAKTIGVSVQQIQKYEKGINRISSGKLNRLAILFRAPLNCFFNQTSHNIFNTPETNANQIAALIKAFNNIKEEAIKDKIVKIIRLFSND